MAPTPRVGWPARSTAVGLAVLKMVTASEQSLFFETLISKTFTINDEGLVAACPFIAPPRNNVIKTQYFVIGRPPSQSARAFVRQRLLRRRPRKDQFFYRTPRSPRPKSFRGFPARPFVSRAGHFACFSQVLLVKDNGSERQIGRSAGHPSAVRRSRSRR